YLHTLQDLFSHSNFVDGGLTDDEKGTIRTILSSEPPSPPFSWQNVPSPPSNLSLTSYANCITDSLGGLTCSTVVHTGDPYTHADHAKDPPDRSGFSDARQQASLATFLIAASLKPQFNFDNVCPPPQPPSPNPAPGPGPGPGGVGATLP